MTEFQSNNSQENFEDFLSIIANSPQNRQKLAKQFSFQKSSHIKMPPILRQAESRIIILMDLLFKSIED